MRSFPFGRAALSILVLGLLAGLALALTPPSRKNATLTMWVFADVHYRAYQQAIPEFEKTHPGVTVDLQQVSNSALVSRLNAAFLADIDVPDLVEVEISSAGTLFRGPIQHVGFSDLTERIHRTGLWDRMVQARFAPYTKRDKSGRPHIFGIPHDVHPVQLAYRRDLLEAAGVDVTKIQTWDDFIRIGKRVSQPGKRYLIEMNDAGADNFETCLFQRGGGYFDPDGKCIMDNETAVQTMLWYVPLVASGSSSRIGNNLGGGQILTKAVEDGYFLCLIAPDWRTKGFEADIPRVEGKMALMPLPAVTPGGKRTSTWGGTMLGITKKCRNQDLAWELAMHLYLNKKDLAQRFRDTNILPAARDAWTEPAYREKRPYWSGQRLGKTYVALAPDVPYQWTSPFVSTAKSKMSEALVACVQRYNSQGDKDFEPFVRAALKSRADEVRRLIARNPY